MTLIAVETALGYEAPLVAGEGAAVAGEVLRAMQRLRTEAVEAVFVGRVECADCRGLGYREWQTI